MAPYVTNTGKNIGTIRQSCGGGVMALARKTDPQTSHEAARTAAIGHIRDRVLWIFEQHLSLTDEELITLYRKYERSQGWNMARADGKRAKTASDSGIRSRRKELTVEGKLFDTYQTKTTESGRKTIIWAIGMLHD